METAQKIFFGFAAFAGIYLLMGWGAGSVGRSIAQSVPQIAQAQQAGSQPTTRTGGHYMPNGQWMANGSMGGMACGMGGGGGCGCGGGR